jgi:TonB family protein
VITKVIYCICFYTFSISSSWAEVYVLNVSATVEINALGHVSQVEFSGKPDEFLASIIRPEVQRWQFHPVLANGKSVRSTTYLALKLTVESGQDAAVIEIDAAVPGPTWKRGRLRYPKEAIKSGVEGLSVLRIRIEPNGTVSDIALVKPEVADVLSTAAIDAIRQWVFIPQQVDGRPVSSTVLMPVQYCLRLSMSRCDKTVLVDGSGRLPRKHGARSIVVDNQIRLQTDVVGLRLSVDRSLPSQLFSRHAKVEPAIPPIEPDWQTLLNTSASDEIRSEQVKRAQIAAGWGDGRAQYTLGSLYRLGSEHPAKLFTRDDNAAARNLSNAAINGVIQAMADMAELRLTQQNYMDAIVWALLYARYLPIESQFLGKLDHQANSYQVDLLARCRTHLSQASVDDTHVDEYVERFALQHDVRVKHGMREYHRNSDSGAKRLQ